MFLKTVILVLACGLSFGMAKKTVESPNLSSLGDGEGANRSQYPPVTGGENQLLNQHHLLQNHDRMLREAYSLIRQQARKMSQQEDVLRQQAETLKKQGELLERLLSEQQQQQQAQTPDNNPHGGKSVSKDAVTEEAEPAVSGKTTTHEQEVLKNGIHQSVWRPPHPLQTRSDDSGPLQIVIDHLSQKVTLMDSELQALQNSYQQVKDVQASTFVRWGNSHCSSSGDSAGDSSELVYSGVIGGSWYNNHGAANPLCLSMHPVHSNQSVPSGMAYLYGAEYHTYDDHFHKDPVCAVCRSTYSTTIMVPGTNVCAAGWHLDYSGFLMGGYYNQNGGSQFICVDSAMQGRVGSDKTEYGVLLYYTVTQCGSLPCEPYVQNKVVTCAVCSK